MARQLEGKVALITGGGSGIGRATALAFVREGAKVVVADVVEEGGQETVRLVQAAGGEASFRACDVSDARQVESLIGQVVETHGRLDCAFNNAGIEGAAVRTADYTEADWDRVIAVDLKGVWLCMKHEIQQMLSQGGGAIVNTASAAGLVGSHGMPAYSAAKHGVVGLTKVAALEYARQGIRVNAVCPGVIQTPMVERLIAGHPRLEARLIGGEPIGRAGRPEEIAEAVVWLCSDAASFVTGHPMAVDGGFVAY